MPVVMQVVRGDSSPNTRHRVPRSLSIKRSSLGSGRSAPLPALPARRVASVTLPGSALQSAQPNGAAAAGYRM